MPPASTTKPSFAASSWTHFSQFWIKPRPSDKPSTGRVLFFKYLELHKKCAAAKTEHDQTPIKRQIETTDKLIDEVVYEVYGRTEEERKIVEGKIYDDAKSLLKRIRKERSCIS